MTAEAYEFSAPLASKYWPLDYKRGPTACPSVESEGQERIAFGCHPPGSRGRVDENGD